MLRVLQTVLNGFLLSDGLSAMRGNVVISGRYHMTVVLRSGKAILRAIRSLGFLNLHHRSLIIVSLIIVLFSIIVAWIIVPVMAMHVVRYQRRDP